MPANHDVIRYLRTASLAEIRETLREAGVCAGWRYYDDEGGQVDLDNGDEPHDAFLETLCGHSVGHFCCYTLGAGRLYGERGGTGLRIPGPWLTREQAEAAVEDAAIAAGWRVPWREEVERGV